MTDDSPRVWVRWLRWSVLGLAGVWAVGLLLVFLWRSTFAMELEWMEGGLLHQAWRLTQGEPIYPPPSRDFVPFLYTPGFPAVVAGLSSVFPLGYTLGRAVSILSWAAIGAGLWRAVGREGKPPVHQGAAVGLFCAGYVFSFRWVDLARPDALFLALTLWGLVLLRESWGNHKKAVLAGVLIALGFWTKQTAAVFIIASGVAALLVAPRQLWSYALTIAIIDGGGVLVGNRMTDGWLWTYIYELHQSHTFNEERFTTKTWGMFAHAAPMMVVLAGGLVADFVRPWLGRNRRLDRRGDERRRTKLRAHRGLFYWTLIAVAGLLVSALGYSTQWAEPNAFLPGVCFGALFIAVALPDKGPKMVIGLALIATQMLFSMVLEPVYQPIQNDGWSGVGRSYRWQELSRTVPSAQQKAAASALRGELESTQGEVLALSRPWWSVIAGGRGHVGTMGIKDVDGATQRKIREQLLAELRAGRYSAIWLDGEPPVWLRAALSGYRVERRLQGKVRVRPFSGWMSEAGVVRPYRADQILMVRVSPRPPPAGATAIADFEDGTLQGFAIRGGAFGPRPVRSVSGKLPPPGPFGGEYLLSSAGVRGNRQGLGSATSEPFILPDGGYLEMLAGTTGTRKGLALEIVEFGESGRVESIPLPRTRYTLEAVRWEITPSWSGATIQVRLRDDSPKAALYFDDLWLVPGS